MNHKGLKLLIILSATVAVASTCATLAAAGGSIDTIGKLLCSIKMNSFRGIYRLIFMFSYVSGFAVIGNAIFKLKQVKDNPTQIPVSTPIALFVCGTLLMLLPSIIEPIGKTLFGTSASLDSGYTISGSGKTHSVDDQTVQSPSIIPDNLLDTS